MPKVSINHTDTEGERPETAETKEASSLLFTLSLHSAILPLGLRFWNTSTDVGLEPEVATTSVWLNIVRWEDCQEMATRMQTTHLRKIRWHQLHFCLARRNTSHLIPLQLHIDRELGIPLVRAKMQEEGACRTCQWL